MQTNEMQTPVAWIDKLIVCNKCGRTSMKTWAKKTEKEILCQRCHPSVVNSSHPYMDEAN